MYKMASIYGDEGDIPKEVGTKMYRVGNIYTA